MADDKTCFIAMPISTPETHLDKYRDGEAHFAHVLECLFIPAVEKAGFDPLPPTAKGSNLIHAEIVSNLETATLVLCDMSTLNPNVFFEFGIRTSLNKPVCVVRDEYTKKVPFDTGILNHQEYSSRLDPWDLDKEIERLAEHIRSSGERSKGKNTLWQYFGLKIEAGAYAAETGTDAKIEYLTAVIEALRQNVNVLADQQSLQLTEEELRLAKWDRVFNRICSVMRPESRCIGMEQEGSHVIVEYDGELKPEVARQIRSMMRREGTPVKFRRKEQGGSQTAGPRSTSGN